jgi:hypothetical protein
MIVAKFGGTSVADAAAIGRLAGIVRQRAADRPVVVVSALAKVTDALLGMARLVQDGDATALDAALAALLERHASTARKLPGAAAAMAAIESDLAGLGQQLAAMLGRALRPARRPPPAGASSGAAASSRPPSRAPTFPPPGWTSVRSCSPTIATAAPHLRCRRSPPGRVSVCGRCSRPAASR